MKIHRFVPFLVLAGAIAGPAVAIESMPGEWEFETKIDGMNTPIPKSKHCVTAEQAKTLARDLVTKDIPKDCKMTHKEDSSTQISFEMICEDAASKLKMHTKGTVKQISKTEILMDSTVTLDMAGKKETQQLVTTEKFISETCSGQN